MRPPSQLLHRAYAVFSWGIIAFGILHASAATRIYDTLTPATLWFVAGGFLMIATGAVNLLNRAYGRSAPGVRRVCIGMNFIMTAFTVLGGVIGRASLPQMGVVVGLFAITSLLALPLSSVQPGVIVRQDEIDQ